MKLLGLFVAVCIISTFSDASEKPEFAIVIYRHGDRTPIKPYPNDPWKNESCWPVKFGQLTNIGKLQHFYFGMWLRQRYSYMLSAKYDPKEVRIQSTDVDRTLMSAQTNLAGMYPPKGNAIWYKKLMWQPIPIHTTPEVYDKVLAMKMKCPAYTSKMQDLKQSQIYKDELSKYKSVMEVLRTYTGANVTDFEDINDIYNTLFIEALNKMTLPPWTVKVYPDKMRVPACFSFSIPTFNMALARLKVGPLITEIMEKLVAVAKKQLSYKLLMYSAHDITIASVLNAMGVFDGNCPVYTSAIFFELFRAEEEHDYYVQVSYRNTTDNAEPIVLNIPDCGVKCPLDMFISLYQYLHVPHWEEECTQNVTAF